LALVTRTGGVGRFVALMVLAAPLMVLLALYLLERHSLLNTPWDAHPERLAGVHSQQGFQFGATSRDALAGEKVWFDYWWARVPVRGDDRARPDRLVKQSPVSLLTTADGQRIEVTSDHIYPVRIASQSAGEHSPSATAADGGLDRGSGT
jgi:hypothetical protein